jgi:outer membrane protein
LQLEQQIDKLQIKDARRNNLPTVSIFANYSQEFKKDRFHYGESQSWNPFSYVGVKLTVPISAHFRKNNFIKKYQYLSEQTEIELQQTETNISFEIEKAGTKLDNALRNMDITHKNYNLSCQIYENQKQQYQLGGFDYDHLLDTEKSLNTAGQNYIQSVYDYLIAKLNYEKALGE